MRVRFYGFLKDYVGSKEYSVSLESIGLKEVGADELPKALARLIPGFSKVLRLEEEGKVDLIYLINEKPLTRDSVIRDDDVVDVLPPASGG